MLVQPYLMFEGRCAEALDFYTKALGAKVEAKMLFKESPEPCPPAMERPEMLDKVMHSSFKVGDSTIMASDGMCNGKPNFQGITLSISVDSEAEADRLFGALAEGGQVNMPLAKTFFSPRFGMVSDKFGVSWMVLVYHV